MYAIVEVGAKQYTVNEGDVIDVELIDAGESKTVDLDRVLLVVDKENVEVGKPYIKGAHVKAEIQGEFRARKVIAYKFRRRKSSHTKRGHRQNLNKLLIKKIAAPKV